MAICAFCNVKSGEPHLTHYAIAKKMGLERKAPTRAPIYPGAIVIEGKHDGIVAICIEKRNDTGLATLRLLHPNGEDEEVKIQYDGDSWRWPLGG